MGACLLPKDPGNVSETAHSYRRWHFLVRSSLSSFRLYPLKAMDGRTEWEYGVRETAQHLELRQAVSATVLLGNLGDGLHFCGLQSSLSVKARVESEN